MNRPTGTTRPLAVALLALAASGCAAGYVVEPDRITDPALAEIVAAFARSVDAAHRDPAVQWHSGWTGNVARVLGGDHAEGLCTEWQARTYLAVRDTAARHRWAVAMVRLNRGPLEHNAVVVFDPQRITRAGVYRATRSDPAWVLDGWARGRADVFTVPDWIATQGLIYRGLEVFDGETELALRRAKHPTQPPHPPPPSEPSEPAVADPPQPSLFRHADE